MSDDTSQPPDGSIAPAGADLGDLAALAREIGAAGVADDAEAVARRVAEGRFYVACVGQFKRGKSTLLNALVGRPLLPVGVLPVTSVPTVLRFGDRLRARVLLSGGEWRDVDPSCLGAWVTEERNPGNTRGVVAVEVFVPSPLLAGGLCLVDTPGVGSIRAGNTAATRALVPHVDAAVVVLGADPPISGEEMALVEEIAAHVETLVFVLNKADRLPAGDCAEAARFAEAALTGRLGTRASPLLHLSASEALAGSPTRDWERLERSLSLMARTSGADLVRMAGRRAASRLAARLLGVLDERRDALVRPIAESEGRIAALGESVAAAERSMADLGFLLNGEVERLARRFAEHRDEFLAGAAGPAREELRKQIDAPLADSGAALRDRASNAAIAIARRHLDAWLADAIPVAEALYRATAERFLALGDEFLGRFLASEMVGPDRLPPGLGHEAGFRAKSGLFYTELLAVAEPSVISWLADRMRPVAATRRAVARDAAAYLDRLLATNSARAQNDLVERVRESRRLLEAEIRARLVEALRSATGALERARARRAEGDASVAAELERLREWESRARRGYGPAR